MKVANQLNNQKIVLDYSGGPNIVTWAFII